MPNTTPNLGLTKPLESEYYNINVHNENMDKLDTAINARALKSKSYTATLTAAGWTGSSAPYTQTVTVSGLPAGAKGTVGLADAATDEQYEAAVAAMLRKTAQASNSITIKAYGEKPSVNIPIVVLEVG
jgi:hypothetical protein